MMTKNVLQRCFQTSDILHYLAGQPLQKKNPDLSNDNLKKKKSKNNRILDNAIEKNSGAIEN